MWFLSFFLDFFALSEIAQEVNLLHKEQNSNQYHEGGCRKTKVVIHGAGVSGITAAQALSKASIEDFVIIEYNDRIGGRCKQTEFGKNRDGKPYNVEIGANWIQGTTLSDGHENPILSLAKTYNVASHPSNSSSLATYDHTGRVDFFDKLDKFDRAYSSLYMNEAASIAGDARLSDTDLGSALERSGHNPMSDSQAQAAEWYRMDYEYAQSPARSSRDFTMANYNSTFGGPGDGNSFVFDQRGFSAFLEGQASEFLEPNDKRLLLNSPVVGIDWSEDGVITRMSDGTCVESEYAINTFSLGVLRSGDVTFSPPLPRKKQDAMNAFQFGTFTKIFLQFPPEKVFWNKSTEFFLYASPSARGYFPVWQSLDHPNFLPGSGILMTTVVAEQAYAIESQDDEKTKQQAIEVLREMFGEDAVPDPIDFMYPSWTTTPWSYGSFSNWPPGFTLQDHQNLRERTGRMLFAGEATSTEYYGYLHGAYFEGQAAGENVAGFLKNQRYSSL